MFQVLPAIDILEGECVRLLQGDYNLKSQYYSSPLEPAKKWEKAGAEWLHIVDLDGAREGKAVNLDIIKKILQITNLKVQIGGGIRTKERARDYLEAGATRIIIGSKALTSPEWVENLVQEYGGEKIVVSLDSKGDKVAKEGWLEDSEIGLFEVATQLADKGVETFIYTDIIRDGTLKGPNVERALQLAAETGKNILVAGGVASLEDVLQLAHYAPQGIKGAVIGRALYTGNIDLAELIQKIEEQKLC